jgi:hypothetical protein
VIPNPRRSLLVEACIAAVLMAAAWLLYAPVVRLWWTHDDLYHLHLLLGNPRAWYFWDRAVYQAPPPKMLTPLLFLSLDADRFLFGLRPAVFHLHQLLSLSLAGPALYGVLRLWLNRAWAAVGAFVFLLGPPVASIVLMVMVRHYVEVFLPAALSVALWVLAMRRPEQGGRLALGSAIAWFLAALEKETAVPLALFLPLLPEGSVPERVRRWVPHAVGLLLYMAIRVGFLGSPKGYGFEVTPGGWVRLALTLPVKVAAEMRGRATPAAWVFLAILLAGLVVVAWRSRGNALRVGAALAFALGPVFPVSTQMEPRYAVVPWLVAALAFPFFVSRLERRWAAALAVVACGAGLIANRQDWAVRYADSARRSAEWRFFLSMRPGELLRQPLGVPGEWGELRWWKEDVQGLPRGAGWFFDDLYLCLHPEAGQSARIWSWDEGAGRIVDLTPRIPELRRRFCGAIRWDSPLQAALRAEPDGLSWELGPWEEGRYWFVLGDGAVIAEVPRRGAFRLLAGAPRSLRVKYESPEGWVAYSAEVAPVKDKDSRDSKDVKDE